MFESVGLGMLMPVFQNIQETEKPHLFTEYAKWGLEIIGLEHSFTNVIILFVCAILLKYVFVGLSFYLAGVLRATVEYDLRKKVFATLIYLPFSFFGQKNVGDFVAAQFISTNRAGIVVESLVLVVNSLVFCILYLILNFMISISLTLLVLGVLTVCFFLYVPSFRKGYLRGEKESQGVDSIHSYVSEIFSGIKTVKVFGNAARHIEHYRACVGSYRRVSLQVLSNRTFASFAPEPIIFLLMTVCLFVSVSFLKLSFVELTVFLAISLQILPKLKTMASHFTVIGDTLPDLGRTMVCTESEEHPPEGRASLGVMKKGVRFESVSFAYPGSGSNALNEISAWIEKGGTTALVGASGGGKTTFVDLLLRLYEPTRGVIYVDGVDLRDVSAHEWRSRIGVVEQEPHLFNDTVFNNIRYGNLEADEKLVRSAAETAYVHEYIEELPEGYRTIIGNRGFKLSGGQKQRLALARALVRSPEILVLDEATSALDSEAERLIQIAVQRLSGRVTILVVAHRLSTIKNADKILVLENGRILQEGSHDSLMRKEGQYRKLVELQS